MKERMKALGRRCVDAVKSHRQFYIFAVLTVLVAAVYVSVMHQRTLPFAEGWYTYYAKCIHEGQVPYRDFEYLYSPVYIYFVALVTKIFGYDLIVLRRLGILFFALIALGLYLSVSVVVGKRRSYISLIAALAGVFYLQSEVVQTFYDYVRLMDALAAFSLYFLLKTVLQMVKEQPYERSLVGLGICVSLFINIKQNTGLVFFAYALVLLVYIGIWRRYSAKTMIRDVTVMVIPVVLVMGVIFACLAANGALSAYLSMTGVSAAGAKGGMMAVLFGWIGNNASSFLAGLPVALILLIFLVGFYLVHRFYLAKKYPCSAQEETGITLLGVDRYLGWGFILLLTLALLLLVLVPAFAEGILPYNYLSAYSVFLAVFPIFAAFGVWGIVDMVRGRNSMQEHMLLFTLSGAYFAISFACGNSGGLAEGQASFGIAFLVAALFLLLEMYREHFGQYRPACTGIGALQVAVACLCLLITVQSIDKKMVNTYNWWGMDESDFWANTETMNLPLLQGIRLSPETKAVYEGICNAIMENTKETDPIYCFPQIPMIYAITGRSDPGVFAKVQWFDVSSDKSVIGDIEVLKQNPPKAIVIYNTSDYAYTSHENAFRGGNVSGTREMREFLYNFVADNGYRFVGNFKANSNSLSLWIADESGATPKVNFAGGTGTEQDPYLVSSSAEMQMLCNMIEAGRTFHGQYVKLVADVDVSGCSMPEREVLEEGFAGTFLYNGYTLDNCTWDFVSVLVEES